MNTNCQSGFQFPSGIATGTVGRMAVLMSLGRSEHWWWKKLTELWEHTMERKWRISAKESKFIVIIDCHFLAFVSIILFLFIPSTTSIPTMIYTSEKVSNTQPLGMPSSLSLVLVHIELHIQEISSFLLLSLPPPHWPTSNHPCHPLGVSLSFISPIILLTTWHSPHLPYGTLRYHLP